MKNDIILVGGGGHCKVVIDAIRSAGDFTICGVLDPNLAAGEAVLGVRVLGSDEMIPRLRARGIRYAFIGVGSIGNCDIRKKLDAALRKYGFTAPVIIHPKAIVAKDTKLGAGTFVAAGAIVNPGVSTGKHVIINTSASVDHDCMVGDFVHIAPGVTLSGGVVLGAETHVGTGARIIQSLSIGKRCIIGAGQTVRHNMPDGQKSYGSAARRSPRRAKVFIIAEAGVNHNGSLALAKKLVDAAKKAGADAVKFQTFKAENVVCVDAPKAGYQKKTTHRAESQFVMLKKLELGVDAHKELIRYCGRKNITFLSTPFDPDSVALLHRLGLGIFKIPSGEITNFPYLEKIGRLGKKVIMSTGMATVREIKDALDVLVKAGTPKEDITILHCTSEYPAPIRDVNLSAMQTIKEMFGVEVGYSDHTLGTEVPIAAAAMGASIIEKHFTLDRKMKGPDHKASLEPDELTGMIKAVRNIEQAMGDGIKKPSASEAKNIETARRSIVASRDIKKGEVFTEDNIAAKRPSGGISPIKWDKVIGRTAKKSFSEDRFIEL